MTSSNAMGLQILAKEKTDGSNPFTRSELQNQPFSAGFLFATLTKSIAKRLSESETLLGEECSQQIEQE